MMKNFKVCLMISVLIFWQGLLVAQDNYVTQVSKNIVRVEIALGVLVASRYVGIECGTYADGMMRKKLSGDLIDGSACLGAASESGRLGKKIGCLAGIGLGAYAGYIIPLPSFKESLGETADTILWTSVAAAPLVGLGLFINSLRR